MLIGAGDLGERVATSLMLREKIDELTLVDLPGGGGPKAAEYMTYDEREGADTFPFIFNRVNLYSSKKPKYGKDLKIESSLYDLKWKHYRSR